MKTIRRFGVSYTEGQRCPACSSEIDKGGRLELKRLKFPSLTCSRCLYTVKATVADPTYAPAKVIPTLRKTKRLGIIRDMEPNKSLLDLARETGITTKAESTVTDEEVQFALAWARGQITATQATKAMNSKHGTNSTIPYTLFARGLRKYIVDNNL